MSTLRACSSRSFNLISSAFLRDNQISLKSISPIKYNFVTFRYFSWEGFFISVSTSTPVLTLQNALLDFHSISGLPWWAVISLTTLSIRTFVVFPLTVHQNQVIARLANLNLELGKMAPELNKEVNIAARRYGWDEQTAKKVFKSQMKQFYQKFILRDNCHPFKIALLAIFQIPVWICLSVSLRNFTLNPSFLDCDTALLQQQLKSEGTMWFPDLTVPDPILLPVLLACVNIALIEIHSLRQIGKGSKFQKILLNVMRLVSVVVAGVAAFNPSSVSFYWLCSSTFGLSQSIILMLPRCRRFLKIPRTTNESLTPFKDIASNFKKRFLS